MSVHGFRCYDNIAPNAKCQRVLLLSVCLVIMSFIVITINSLSIVSPFLVQLLYVLCAFIADIYIILEMWANAQRDGRPAEYMWRRLFNAAKFG